MSQGQTPLGAAPMNAPSQERSGCATFLVGLPLLVAFVAAAILMIVLVPNKAPPPPVGGPTMSSGPSGMLSVGIALATWIGFVACLLLTRAGVHRGFGGKSTAWTATAIIASVVSLVWVTACVLVAGMATTMGF